jgi:hypothetical protein
MFFASVSWGQLSIAWPSAPYSPPSDVRGADTIYFCETSTSVYPIELGVDVAGKKLHPSYGDWVLISKTSDDVTAAEYDLGVLKGNKGAGNAYKVVGSGIGGLLFEYKATSDLCGLAVGEKFWIYVFNLPNLDLAVGKDTVICKETAGTKMIINLQNSFSEYFDLYAKAGIEYTWRNAPATHEIAIDTALVYTLEDTLDITKSPVDYKCGLEGHYRFIVRVQDTIGQLQPVSRSICAADTVGDLGDRSPNEIFGRIAPNGSYSPAKINEGTWESKTVDKQGGGSVTVYFKKFKYSYDECGGKPGKTIEYDTLELGVSIQDLGYENWGEGEVIVCRTPGTLRVTDLYDSADYSAMPIAPPALNTSNSYWKDKGVTNGYPVIYGTTSGNSSLISDYDVNLDDMQSSVRYHYLWRPDAGVFPCLIGATSKVIDSGWIAVVIQDDVTSQDYAAQLCKTSYTNADKFDLNAFTGLAVTWTSLNGGVDSDGHNVTVPDIGTYTYKYKLNPKCGAGGPGVLYLKVTNGVRTSTVKEISYCIKRLPSSINLNEALGAVVNGLKWTNDGSVAGFDTTTGILDIAQYAASVADMNTDRTLTFTIDETNASDLCGITPGTQVKLHLVTNIIN